MPKQVSSKCNLHFHFAGKNPSRGGILLAKMAELKRANCEHHEMANLTIQQNPDISFGQLWQEIFTFQ
jgi:hypothetical protein